MKIWNDVLSTLRSWRLLPAARPPRSTSADGGGGHLERARESLRELLDDRRVPAQVREALADDYAEIERMLEKLEHGHVHIAAFGRVGVGKSSLLNALLGEQRFSVSALHGETTGAEMSAWRSARAEGVYLIDTPGINEIDGEQREELAREVASRVDLVMFVADGDLTETEVAALRLLSGQQRPMVLVLNKVDRYGEEDRRLLLQTLAERSAGVVAPANIVAAAADPAPRTYVYVAEDGSEQEQTREPEPQVEQLRERLWAILEAEGQTLAALNAGLFAGSLSDRVARRILAARRELGDRLIRTYAVTQGVAVAFNPVPVADLFAAAVVDAAMVWHLSRLYDLPMARSEARSLVGVIATQLAAVVGTAWAVHLVSAALKFGTVGVSTLVTAGAQGAVAYYATFVVGKVAERYLAQGKSWGEGGPKLMVEEILDSIDRDSILAQARSDIRQHLRSSST